MKLLDTNVILRYLMGDVPNQAQAAYRLIQRIARGEEEALLLDSVVHEACYVLSSSRQGYNLPHDDIKNRLLPIINLPQIRMVNKNLCLDALDIFAESEKRDFTDALQVAYVRHGLVDGIYSFDVGFDKAAGANRIDPASLR